ncbi:MAG: single-stranded DNA-binding protein, partial [Polaromonas sp.]|nr:single-stranded DNA-binding protein [Polaromonas sp.]
GRSVYIEGRLKTRKYTDKDGVEKYATDIIASEMQMLGSREGMGGPGGNDGGDEGGGERSYSRPPAAAPRPPAAAAPRPPAPTKAASGFDDMDDDIPF